MTLRKHTKIVHEGKYIVEVDIEIIDTNDGWSPYLSLDDALRLDDVRDALKRGDVVSATKQSRGYEISCIKAA
jgi:hypothetical protein